MENQDKLKGLIAGNGCLTAEGIGLFLKVETGSDEYRLLYNHIKDCELCRDAVEGYRIISEIKPGSNHGLLIGDLRKNVLLRAKGEKIIPPARKTIGSSYLYLAAAAFILIAGFLFFLKLNQPKAVPEQPIAKNIKQQQLPPDTSHYIAMLNTDKKEVIRLPKSQGKRSPESNKDIPLMRDEVKYKDKSEIIEEKKVQNIVITESQGKAEMPETTGYYETIPLEKDAGITKKEVSKSGRKVEVSEKPSANKSAPGFMMVQESPSFPGGEDSLQKFLLKNLKYPKLATEKGVEGIVTVSFIVKTNGSISNLVLVKGIGSGCDEETLRIIKLMPRWKPGKISGKNVDVKICLPVKFSLAK